MPILGIIVHHTVTRQDVPISLLRRNHVEKRRFRDVAYNWIVRRSGRVGNWAFESGRPEYIRGAHCPGKNSTHLSVAVAGDYTTDDFELEAQEILAEVLADICSRYDMDPELCIHPHSQFRDTLCPGRNIESTWKDIIEGVKALLPLERV